MATSAQFSTSNQYIVYWLEVTTSSQSVANNTSTVNVKCYFKRTNYGYTTYGTGTLYLGINGTSYSIGVSPSQEITSTPICLANKTVTIPHNADGTITIWVSARLDHNAVTSADHGFNVTLTAIPRASSFSFTGDTLGSAVTVSITKAVSSYTHTICFAFGDANTTLITKTAESSYSFTPALDTYCKYVPNSTSGTGTITVDTYSGNTKVGSTSKNITLKVPSSVVPTFTSLDVNRVDGSVPTAWGLYVQSKSKATITITGAAGVHGSTIKSYSILGGGYSSSNSSFTTGFLNTSGTVTFKATVTDSRGRTATKTISINVIAYAPPSIGSSESMRCLQDGTASGTGTTGKTICNYAYSSVNGKNTVTATVKYRVSGTTAWSNAVTVKNNGDTIFGSGNLLESNTYDVQITVKDAFATVTKIDTINSASRIMNMLASGNGIAFGTFAEEEDTMESAWKIKGTSGMDIAGDSNFSQMPTIGAEPMILTGGTTNNYYTKFANGLLIIYQKVAFTVPCNNQWGNIYSSKVSENPIVFPDYPIAFASIPVTTVSVQTNNTNNANTGDFWVGTGNNATYPASKTNAGSYQIFRGTAMASISGVLNLIAIGRWK